MLNNFLKLLDNIKIKNFVYISSDVVFSDSMNLLMKKQLKSQKFNGLIS